MPRPFSTVLIPKALLIALVVAAASLFCDFTLALASLSISCCSFLPPAALADYSFCAILVAAIIPLLTSFATLDDSEAV